jgi:hypothetical protein
MRAHLQNDPLLVDRRRDIRRFELDKAMAIALEKEGARYISVISSICEDSRCVVRASDGEPLQRDYGHLTHSGAVYIANQLRLQGRFPLD